MRNLKWLYPGLLCLAAGCIGPASRPKPVRVADAPEQVMQKDYSPDVPRSATPGETMLKVKDYWVQSNAISSIVLDRAVTITTGKRVITLPHGAVLVSGGSITIKGKFYTMYHNANDDSDFGVIYYFNPDMSLADFLYLKDRRTFPTGMETITRVLPESFRLPNIPAPTVLRDRDYQNYEMVFKGLGSDGIHLIYREFLPGVADPSFQQELTYPSDTERITYKNIELKIDGCSEQHLDFTVVSN